MTAYEQQDTSAGPEGFDRVGLLGFWIIIRRHIWKILLIVALVVGATWFALGRLDERFGARATLVLTLQDTRISQTNTQLESFDLTRSVIETELDVLRSREFATQVAETLSLFDNPDFVNVKEDDPAVPTELRRNQVIDKVQSSYSVRRSGESLAVDIITDAGTAQLAADLANTVADVYIQNTLSKQTDSFDTSIAFLRDRVSVLGEELTKSELEMADFIRENNLDDVELPDRLRSQVLYLNTILKTADQDGRNNETVTKQREELAKVQAELQDRTRAELTQLRKERLLELLQSRYQTAIEKLNELETQVQFVGQGARHVTIARVPTKPSWPNKPVALAIATAAGLFLAIIIALMLDAINRRIWNEEQTIHVSGIGNAGFIPSHSNRFSLRRKSQAVECLVKEPRSMFAQAVRSITSHWVNGEQRGWTVMVTSGLPDEGKSTVSVSIATSAALDGFKVLVIDLDAHRKGGSRQFNYTGESQKLAEVASGEVAPTRISYDGKRIEGLDLYTLQIEGSGNLKDQRALLSQLKERVKNEYDLIIVDTPPVLVVDDACRYGVIADEIWQVVRWSQTTENVLRDGVERLQRDGLPVTATIINDVDTRRQRKWGYGGYAQYYNYGNAYYR